jgi:hypothetical protein
MTGIRMDYKFIISHPEIFSLIKVYEFPVNFTVNAIYPEESNFRSNFPIIEIRIDIPVFSC